MKTAVLVHGWPDKKEYFDPTQPAPSNAHWFPWVQRQLLLNGILAQTPEMPDAWEPNYEKWSALFERFDINEDTTLIGHSCGGGFLVRWLSEHNVKVGKVVLVAPWLDPDHQIDKNFFSFAIDERLVEKTDGLSIMYSTDDFSDIIESIEILKSALKDAVFNAFADKGHFVLEDMKTEAFPELLETLGLKALY
ncbi:MAG TPA: alpha/beta fold hydrolase [Candidatus Paceibacterota bacterium]|jgi:predicted alpha/beta hydrolase family esterase|nr:alpha/beta fold hydrolase [Candidatus Paceibacterota bacterium]